MSAQDYGISFPYGATSAPYSPSKPHKGDDRACPTGTPIVINGQTIGLTGNTGLSTGPHLHIQEWNGSYGNTRKPQNSFKPGTVTNIDPAGTQGDGSFGKFITIQTADGWNDTYCHLSRIDVQVGQIIGGDMPTKVDDGNIDLLYVSVLHRHAGQADKDARRGQDYLKAQTELYESKEWANQDEALKNPNYEKLTFDVFKKKGQ